MANKNKHKQFATKQNNFATVRYYVLQQLYFAEWERLWFMEVGFWQILFSVIFFAIMILWRPSEHFKRYGESLQLGGEDDEDVFNMPKPDTMDDNEQYSDEANTNSDDDDDNNAPQAKFIIGDEDDDSADGQRAQTTNNKNSTSKKIQKVAEQFLGDDDEERQLAAAKMQ